jgi:hypothetical protein
LPNWLSILPRKDRERLAVGGVAGQDLIGERQTLRRHHEGDDELRAIGPPVAAVAVAAFGSLGQVGGVDLEIGAGQVVEQPVERGVEQIAPALRQMREQSLFVFEQHVVAGVELMRLGEAEVGAKQAAMALSRTHWRCNRHSLPGAMSRYVASTCSTSFQRVPLRLAGSRSAQKRSSCSSRHRTPASQHAPHLARPAKAHLRQTQADHVAVFGERAAILGEQGDRPRPTGVLVEDLDRLAPRLGLGRVDLAEVKDMALDHPPAVEALALDNAPVEMRLSVLPPLGLSQEHRGNEFATSRGYCDSGRALLGLHYRPFRLSSKIRRLLDQVLSSPQRP